MRFFLVLLLLCATVYGLPVGNPAQASLYKRGAFFNPCEVSPCSPLFMFVGGLDFRAGFYGDSCWNRELEQYIFGTARGTRATSRMKTSAGYVVGNIYGWMDVFGTFGVSTIQVRGNAPITQADEIAFFSPSFSWSVGSHATLYRCGPFYIGGAGQYFRTQPDLNSFFNYDSGADVFFNNTNSTAWEEWQVAFGCTLALENELGTGLAPYAAIKFNQGKFVLHGFQFTYQGLEHQLPDLEPTDFLGWALGCTLIYLEAMSVTIEGRWLNETGVFVNGQLRF